MLGSDIIAVVVSYNGGKKTLRTVCALLKQVGHVHVVDNCSGRESCCDLKGLSDSENVSITWLEKNVGVGAALNMGVQVARQLGFTWVLTMDQDSTVEPGMIAAFGRVVGSQKNALCLCPTIEGISKNTGALIQQAQYAITSGNLVRVDLFDQIGLYNEPLFIDCVDFDFSLRVRQAGHSIIRVGDAHMAHELGEIGPVRGFLGRFHTIHSPLRRYYIYRNYLYFARAYIGLFPGFVLKLMATNVLYVVTIMMYGPERGKSLRFIFRGIRDFFLDRSGAYTER